MAKEFQVRDRRNKGWFWIDDEYLNGYAKHFGPVGTAVYLALCRYAHIKDQTCYPTQKLLADKIGTTTRTVIKYIGLFEKYKLIRVERQKGPFNRYLANVYILLDKSGWQKPGETISHGLGETNDINQVKQFHTKEKYKKETYIQRKRVKSF